MSVKDFISRAWKSLDAEKFPGPQPVSIERRHFPLLKKQPYVVCEKTDGVRHLLASFSEGVFLVNRAFHTEKVALRIPKDTLLDGELIQLKNGKLAFIVHDAVMVKNEDVSNLSLTQRLDKATRLARTIIKTASAPFEIRIKTMRPLGSSVPEMDYETDGLVFTPVNEPIRMGTHETMFKWKPRERITIDFELRNGVELFVQDRGIPYKEAELFSQNERKDLPSGTIVECGYGSLGWFVEKVRTDKTHPNNRRTYFRTIINIRENIQLSEFENL